MRSPVERPGPLQVDHALLDEPAWQLRERVVSREVSPVELTTWALERIEAEDGNLHSFVTVAPDAALAAARDAERRLVEGEEPGPLAGVPLSVKDLYWTKDMRTTAGSLVFAHHQPGEDSLHVARARAAGAVVVGKTNVPEFGLFPRTVNRLQPETANPWDLERTCGGSSGGAAASVAARLTPIAIGSDGGGSIRIPAALCGVVGLHPSRGRVPRHGGIGGTLLFSSAGPITRDVRDAALLLDVLSGPDTRDPLAWTSARKGTWSQLEAGVEGTRMLWIDDGDSSVGADPRVVSTAAAAAQRFNGLGARVDSASTGFDAQEWMASFYEMMGADRYAAIGEQLLADTKKRDLLSDYGLTHFERGRTVTGAQYSRALEARHRLIRTLEGLFDGYDLLLSPTVGIVAPRTSDEISRPPLVAYTFFVNYSGFTAATVPCGLVDGMPVGLQVIGRPGDEAAVLRACRAFEALGPSLQPASTSRD